MENARYRVKWDSVYILFGGREAPESYAKTSAGQVTRNYVEHMIYFFG